MKSFFIILFNTLFLIILVSMGIYFYGNSILNKNSYAYWGYPFEPNFSITFKEGPEVVVANIRKYTSRNIEINRKGTKHLYFTGGSQTFGDGIPDDHTLLYHANTSPLLHDYQSELIAQPGWGPANILAFIQKMGFHKTVDNSEGALLYFFIEDHIHRTCGATSYFMWSHGYSPYFTLENGKLTYKSQHKETLHFEFFKFIYGINGIRKNLLNEKDLLLYDLANFEYGIFRKDCKSIFRAVIEEIGKEYNQRFPKGKFYAIPLAADYMPYEGVTPDHISKPRELLKNIKGVHYVELQHQLDKALRRENLKNEVIYIWDKHVSGKYHELMIPILFDTIKNH